MKRTFTIGLILMLSLAFGIFADGWSVHAQIVTPTIRVGLSGEPPSLDPHIQSGTASRAVRLAIYRGLFNYGKDGEIHPELAESYQISEDGKTYTFVLRDAQFHNGDPVTAEDVKFTLERILDPATGATFRQFFEVVDSIDVIDPKTVQVTLKAPTAPFIHYLALTESAIVSKKWTLEHGGNLSQNPMGAGPYKFVEWRRGQRIVVTANEAYYKPGLPKTERYIYEFYADATARVNALRAGDIDLMDYVPWKDAPALEADPQIQLHTGTGPFMGLVFNTNTKPFADPRVRQAVAYAVDRHAVINTAFSGRGVPIYGMAMPPTSIAYDEAFENYFEYNPEKAKQLLAEAGYPNGFSIRLLSTGQYDFHQQTAVVVAAELQKIGINVELDLPDWATRLEKNLRGEYDLLVIGTAGDITDPDFLTDFYVSGGIRLNNAPGFADDRVDELLMLGRSTIDPEARREIYTEFQQRVLDLSPLVYLMWREETWGANAKLRGFANLPGFLSFQSGITLEEAYLER